MNKYEKSEQMELEIYKIASIIFNKLRDYYLIA